MKRKIFTTLLVCVATVLLSCEDLLSPVTPELSGSVTRDPSTSTITGYDMLIVNIHDVEDSHGGPMFYKLYYVEGEYSKIPDIEPVELPVLECGASGEFGYNNTTFSGKYTFWIVGSEDADKMVNKTKPSNLLVLDFSD